MFDHQPSCALYRNEQETLAALRAKEDSAKNASALQKSQSVAEVQDELATLNESLYAQGYTAENNPTIAPRSPRAAAAGDNGNDESLFLPMFVSWSFKVRIVA